MSRKIPVYTIKYQVTFEDENGERANFGKPTTDEGTAVRVARSFNLKNPEVIEIKIQTQTIEVS